MSSMPHSICSTVGAATLPCAFDNLLKRISLPVLCTGFALILGGDYAGIHAQTSSNLGQVNVGNTSPVPFSVVFTFSAEVTLGSTAVLTQGATGLDFADAGTGTCQAGIAYSAGSVCTMAVNFSPKLAGTRYGAAELLDLSSNVLATVFLQGTGVGPQMTFLPGTQSVVASAAFNGVDNPQGVAVDGAGNVYIVDGINHVLLKETLSSGSYTQSIIADSADNGLVSPLAVAVDGAGNVYVADYTNSQVLKETPSAGSYTQSVIANIASNHLNRPTAVAVDGSGNVYIDDTGSLRVLKETLSAGSYTQSVIANDAINGLNNAMGIAVDGSGNVYIADWLNQRVLKETLTAGGYTQSVVAAPATFGLSGPTGVALDGIGNVYILVPDNSQVLKETPSSEGYTESVIADAANNGLNFPQAIALDGNGNVYIADNQGISGRLVKEDLADPPILTFNSTAVGATSSDSPKTVTVSNNGNAALIFPLPMMGNNPSVPVNFGWDPSSTCVQTTPTSPAAFELAGSASCTMAFDFSPATPGNFNGIAELTDNNLNVANAVQGIPLTVGPQTINFPQPTSPVYFGVTPITLSATGGVSGNPVVFSIVSGPGSLSGVNNSVLTVTGWGTIVIAANQAGNAIYAAAPQVTQSITVLFARPAALTVPAPGSTLTDSSVTFVWSPGVAATEYMLYLGSTGVRSSNLYNSGRITATSVTVSGLPVNGETIYARLYSLIGGSWYCLDSIYPAASLATLASPVPNSTLTSGNVTFTWSAGVDVTLYYLFLGSNGTGSNNLFSSGYTTHTSVNVTGLPENGETIYARLFSFQGGAWHSIDYIVTAESLAALTSPPPGSTLTGSNITFEWSAGFNVTLYYLFLGTDGVGSNNLYDSGYTTHQSVKVTGLPENGETIYARLFSFQSGTWHFIDYTYEAR